MCDESIERLPTTTDDAVRLFFLGQKISLKPLDDRPIATFVVHKLVTPVTKSIVVFAKPNSDGETAEQVAIKIYDPRYLDERISEIPSNRSYPWNVAHERAAAIARTQNAELSDEELIDIIYSDDPEDLSGEDLATHCSFWEERFYRLMVNCYDEELTAYGRLRDLQGSTIPRFIMAGEFLAPDERAIRPPAIVLEYIPSVNLLDVPPAAITPALCEQVISVIESFPPRGVVHNDITPTNIHFTPPECPAKAVMLDFACAINRAEDFEEEDWADLGESDVEWAKKLLKDKTSGKPAWGLSDGQM